jgi:hypothetical protein
MSLQAFQRAVVDLTISYPKVRALRGGDTALLASYKLTPLEKERILDIIRQPGISVHCTLSRGNRLEIVVGAFPMTSVLLEGKMRGLMDELWERGGPTNYQLAGEEIAFAEFIRAKIAAGELEVEYLSEILAYESVCLGLTRRSWRESEPPGGFEAIAEFRHSPDDLLPPLSRLTRPPFSLPEGHHRTTVRLKGKRFEVEIATSAWVDE